MKNSLDTELDMREALSLVSDEYQAFVYSVSHDLSTPLRHINAFGQRLQNRLADQLDSDSREDLKVVLDSAARCKDMLDALVAFSRLNNGLGAMGEVDLRYLYDRALRYLKDNTDVSTIIQNIDDLPKVHGDEKQLAELFVHLLSNAILYRHPERPLAISLRVKEDDDHWRFILKDNGIGLKESMHEVVFGMFQRAVRNSDIPGLGVGLSLSKRIVERHGGEIALLLNDDKGLDVVFSLQKAPL